MRNCKIRCRLGNMHSPDAGNENRFRLPNSPGVGPAVTKRQNPPPLLRGHVDGQMLGRITVSAAFSADRP